MDKNKKVKLYFLHKSVPVYKGKGHSPKSQTEKLKLKYAQEFWSIPNALGAGYCKISSEKPPCVHHSSGHTYFSSMPTAWHLKVIQTKKTNIYSGKLMKGERMLTWTKRNVWWPQRRNIKKKYNSQGIPANGTKKKQPKDIALLLHKLFLVVLLRKDSKGVRCHHRKPSFRLPSSSCTAHIRWRPTKCMKLPDQRPSVQRAGAPEVRVWNYAQTLIKGHPDCICVHLQIQVLKKKKQKKPSIRICTQPSLQPTNTY